MPNQGRNFIFAAKLATNFTDYNELDLPELWGLFWASGKDE
jgi:hypothetical protein